MAGCCGGTTPFRLTGYTDEEIGERALTELFVRDDTERIAAAVEELFESGSTTVEASVATGGGTIPYELRIQRLGDEGRFCALGRDITERVEHEETLRALYGAARSLMTAQSRETVCERAIDTADQILGLSIVTVWLHDEEEAVLRPVAQSPAADDLVGEPPTYTSGTSVSWRTLETKENPGLRRRPDRVGRSQRRDADPKRTRSAARRLRGDERRLAGTPSVHRT